MATTDALPVGEATMEDLALPLFASYRSQTIDAEVIAGNHRSFEEQLASLRFYSLPHRAPTVGGVLLFGRNPRRFLPGAYVQYLRLPAATLGDLPTDQAEIGGDLWTMLRELDIRSRAGIRTGMEPVSALQERLLPDYPEVAIRELLLNAIMHRDYQSNTPVRFYWYADRIEIQSPGGLYGEVTAATLERESSYRNPVVAEAMKALGFVNRFGYGIQRAQEALRRAGHPPAEFEITPRSFLARIRARVA